MIKTFLILAFLFTLASCNGNETTGTGKNATKQDASSNPSAIDTVKHPDGIINGSVISTDTAAMNVQNSIDKAKEAKKEN